MKKKYIYLIVVFLIVVSCAAFGRIAGNDFINLDDNGYITENSYIQSGINYKNVKWAFTAVVISNWHPLTLLSHMLDWNLFGANASGHHIVSLLLHIGSVILLFLFLNKSTNNFWPSAFAAALFALHPLRVESVAWAAERKDVLSMFFGMASIYAYAFYAESSKLSRYLLCLILFALALMSKPMMVTLPFVLLLLDYWPLKRWQKVISAPVKNHCHLIGRLLGEKAPFILLTIASSIVTFCAQNKGGSVISVEHLHFLTRGGNAIVSYTAYLEKIFWPINLAVYYPYEFPLPLWKILISGLILIVITIAVLNYIRKLPFLFVGWFWYIGTLVPVIGLVQVGTQSMADRYTYLPFIGIAIMLAWGVPLLFKHEDIRKKILFPAAVAIITVLTALTCQQCGYWKNSATLFSHALQVTKDNYIAHDHLASSLAEKGILNAAIQHYNEAIRLKPDYALAYNNRGITYYNMGQYQLAIEDFNKTIRLTPDYAEVYNNRGTAYYNMGQYQLAFEDFNKTIRLKPDYALAYNNRALIYFIQGNIELGCRDVQIVCELGNCKFLEVAKNEGICR